MLLCVNKCIKMKQKLVKLLMLIVVLLTDSRAFAYDFEAQNSDGVTIYYNIISEDDKTVEITYMNNDFYSYWGEIEIPTSVVNEDETYKVVSIGENAFSYCSSLTSVTIPNSVTSIGKVVFSSCDSLTSIIVKSGNTKYDSRDNCNAIIETATNSLIHGCQNTDIPNTVTSIGDGVFYGCVSLTSIIVECGNTKYDSRDNCNAIIETTTNSLIQGCQNTVIPNTVTGIGDWAFGGCNELTTIAIPNSVTSIGEGAFEWCNSLTTITIPNLVTNIDNYTFNGCRSLTTITIPNSITSIGDGAFDWCNSLNKIYCKATIPPTYNGWFEDNVLQYATLYIPKECKNAYESVEPWKYFWNIQEMEFSDVKSILTDNNVNVLVENGNIVVTGTDNAKVEVYNVSGHDVYNGRATNIPVSAKGLYIVKVGNKSFKVILW